MARTDFTQEIDGALANRNLGMRHFAEVARSGNGNMRTDLAEDLADFQELDGVGEAYEELSLGESAKLDQLGPQMGAPKEFRWPAPGEVPPYAAKPGFVWLRRRVMTNSRKPGGNRMALAKWVQMSKERLAQVQRDGNLGSFDFMSMGTLASLGAGVGAGVLLWFLLRRKKK